MLRILTPSGSLRKQETAAAGAAPERLLIAPSGQTPAPAADVARITQRRTDQDADRFKLVTARDITVYTRDGLGNLAAATAPADIPAVILSHGKNGYGATSDAGRLLANSSRSNEDEQNNSGADIHFMARNPSENRALPGGEFDDMVVWVSPNILFNRMVAAQVLP
eukprot:gene39226-48449_t